ncbi:MAG: hypothetical protein VSS75_028545, partial [Candidatus Parabeggiatoa sp.]|nr:hypothetical protein [Candidatus Parabeggiatoa sp.]
SGFPKSEEKTSNCHTHGNVLKRNRGVWQNMIKGYFNYRGELFFEMDLMAVDSSIVTMDAMLDTASQIG